MKRAATALIIGAFLILIGHDELSAKGPPACLNPARKAYKQPVIGGICEKCGKTFTFSGHQLDNEKSGTCPYCKHEQNLKEACNRYGEANSPVKKKAK